MMVKATAGLRNGRFGRKCKFSDEDIIVLSTLEDLKQEIKLMRNNLDCVTDETLIDSYIYELKAVQMKYQYYIKLCKERGLEAVYV